MCIDIVEIWFWIAIGYISSIFDRVISPWHDNGGVLSFHVLLDDMINQIFHPCFFPCGNNFLSYRVDLFSERGQKQFLRVIPPESVSIPLN